MLGKARSMSRKEAAGCRKEIGRKSDVALARRERRYFWEEACAGRNAFLALHSTDLPYVQWAEDEGPVETICKSNVESPELQDPVDYQGSHPGFRLRHCRY